MSGGRGEWIVVRHVELAWGMTGFRAKIIAGPFGVKAEACRTMLNLWAREMGNA